MIVRPWLTIVIAQMSAACTACGSFPVGETAVDGAIETQSGDGILKASENDPTSNTVLIKKTGPFQGLLVAPSREGGVLVVGIENNTGRLGLKADDVIEILNGVVIDNVETMLTLIDADAQDWRMTVLRGAILFDIHLIP